jgi:hypothetical protein
MRSLARPARPGQVAPTSILCLPGAYDTIESFLAAGFDSAVERRGLAIDLLFIDPELKHLADRTFRRQLHERVVAPARAGGCRTLWLAGISLGGFMALDFAASNQCAVDGVCLLAPYLGNRMVTGEVARAAALGALGPDTLADSEEERRIWEFVHSHRGGAPLVYLGYGRDDRFAEAHGLLARALPPSAVDVVPGGHDWGTWTTLWEHFLDSRFG